MKQKWTPLVLLGSLFLNGFVLAQKEDSSKLGGADDVEGWIYKKTDKGIIKIPKKQKFKFDGSSLEGDAGTPPASVLQPRLTPDRKSLIPIRTSFQNEYFDSLGLSRKVTGN